MKAAAHYWLSVSAFALGLAATGFIVHAAILMIGAVAVRRLR